jgi:tRNA modification GTPase
MTTAVALLTPPGTAALGVLGLIGPQAAAWVNAHFEPFTAQQRPNSLGRQTSRSGVGQIRFGRLTLDPWADDVLVVDAATPTEPMVEIHTHGNAALLRGLIQGFVALGAVEIDARTWPWRTGVSPFRAEAAAALMFAPTLRVASILLDQVDGAMDRALAGIVAAASAEPPDMARAQAAVHAVAKWSALGRHLTEPWRILIAGAPNAGKSTLFNALLGYERALTSPQPGTTRDVVTARCALEGWLFELMDSAGLRSSADTVEVAGMGKAAAVALGVDLCLWVVDATTMHAAAPPPGFTPAPVLVVLNKVDQLTPETHPAVASPMFPIAANLGQGLAALREGIVRQLIPESPPPGAAVPLSDAWKDWLARHHGQLIQSHEVVGHQTAGCKPLR